MHSNPAFKTLDCNLKQGDQPISQQDKNMELSARFLSSKTFNTMCQRQISAIFMTNETADRPISFNENL